MPVLSNVPRNIRNGTLVFSDGSGTPKTVTVALIEAGYKITENLSNPNVVLERGSIPDGFVIRGDDVGCRVEFSCAAVKRVGKAIDASDSIYTPYEMFHDIGSSVFATTGVAGEVHQFDMVFTIEDIADATIGETFTLDNCYIQEDSFTEQANYNISTFTIHSKNRVPTVTKADLS